MPVQFKDYYETLGVSRTASGEEIKKAFRRLARIHHPDVAKDKKTGEAKFKEINEAYEVLNDPEKRQHYDQLGSTPEGTPFTAPQKGGFHGNGPFSTDDSAFEFTGTGFSDFFEAFFAKRQHDPGAFRRTSTHARESTLAARGYDAEADLLVTLEEALHGATREVTLRRPGVDGEAPRTDTYQVKIPAGVREGQRIRLGGQGGPGQAGGPPGDLLLRVRLARHPDFRVEGADLYYDLDLAPWEAVLGTRVNLPTLDGTVAVQVKPGLPSGSLIRLRGLGLPQDQGGGRGHLLIVTHIQIPSTTTDEERTLWEKLAKTSSFSPRAS